MCRSYALFILLVFSCGLWAEEIVYSPDMAKKAAAGDANAQLALGWCYGYGKGIKQDDQEAAKWVAKSAEQGNAAAQLSLGRCYENGTGVEKDITKARELVYKSARQGHVDAQVYLGVRLFQGGSFGRDESEAVMWWRKAAEQGDPHAENGLAWLLATSYEAKIRNGKEAARWAQQALKQLGESEAFILDTLAAAYAEAGDFDAAISTQEKAIANLRDNTKEKELQERLKSYREKKPWRDSGQGVEW